MVVLDEQKQNFVEAEINEEASLREERRRTGRFVAAGTAIFLSLLGLYQALARGTPEYAALLIPAVIMFGYVLWILYMSKSRKKNMLRAAELLESEKLELEEVKVVPEDDSAEQEHNPSPAKFVPKENHIFCRTYSVA